MQEKLNTTSPLPVPPWLTGRPIAHRGLHRLPETPENSLAAFAASVRAGFPIELDVRLLADGQVAVFHDGDLWRMTGVAGPLAARTAEDLRALRLRGTEERIPLLTDTLALVAGQVPLLIEIKSDPANIGPLEAATLKALEGYVGEFAIQSFTTAAVTYVAEHAPEIVRGQLASNDAWQATAGDAPLPHFLAYQHAAPPTPITDAWRASGRPLIVWTIQTSEQQSRAIAVADNYIFEAILP